MPDPYQIFAGNPARQEHLKILWPDLYDCLVRAVERQAVAKVRPCEVLGRHPGEGPDRPASVARISPDGPAACAGCLERLRPSPRTHYPI